MSAPPPLATLSTSMHLLTSNLESSPLSGQWNGWGSCRLQKQTPRTQQQRRPEERHSCHRPQTPRTRQPGAHPHTPPSHNSATPSPQPLPHPSTSMAGAGLSPFGQAYLESLAELRSINRDDIKHFRSLADENKGPEAVNVVLALVTHIQRASHGVVVWGWGGAGCPVCATMKAGPHHHRRQGRARPCTTCTTALRACAPRQADAWHCSP